MASDIQTLLDSASCYACASPGEMPILELALLKRILLSLDPSADTTVDGLLADSSCYACQSLPVIAIMQTVILARISSLSVTPSDDCIPCWQNTSQYALSPYSDGSVLNAGGDPPQGGETVWTGTFPYKDVGGTCMWMSNYDGQIQFLMNGNRMCVFSIRQTNTYWLMSCYSGGLILWEGRKITGATPDGVYTRTGGTDAAPASLTVVNSGGAVTSQVFPASCLPT